MDKKISNGHKKITRKQPPSVMLLQLSSILERQAKKEKALKNFRKLREWNRLQRGWSTVK